MIGVVLGGCGTDTALDPTLNTGLPCDVQAVLSDRCQSCHGSPLSGGAPIRLVTYEDLAAIRGGAPVAQRCLDRMTDTSSQMPPLPATAVTAAEISTLRAWLDAGMPSGDCIGGGGPFDGPAVCTSGKTWTGGNRESPLMHPGLPCIACHTSSHEGPRFRVAGTLYPTAHEPDDCMGATSAAVEVTDANGVVTKLQVNSAGNFYSSVAFAFPIQVAVVANGNRRAMASSPTTGDCNTCHTQSGASMAPGRIVLP